MAQSTNNPELIQAFIDARNPQSNNPNIQDTTFQEEVGPPPVNNVLDQKNIKAQQLASKLNASRTAQGRLTLSVVWFWQPGS